MAVRSTPTAASKPPGSSAAALVPQGAHRGKPALPLSRILTLIGSRNRAHLHLLSPSVSKSHAVVILSDSGLFVRDLASRTHTLVNGRPVREADLSSGDTLTVGNFSFRVEGAPPAGKPALKPPEASLEVDGAEFPIPFDGRSVLIGRRPTCEIALVEPSVSTVHALIFELNGQRYVRDLGSRTGTYVNGELVHQQALNLGDELRVGDTTILYAADVPAATALEDLDALAEVAFEDGPIEPATQEPAATTAPAAQTQAPASPHEEADTVTPTADVDELIPLAGEAQPDADDGPVAPVGDWGSLDRLGDEADEADEPAPVSLQRPAAPEEEAATTEFAAEESLATSVAEPVAQEPVEDESVAEAAVNEPPVAEAPVAEEIAQTPVEEERIAELPVEELPVERASISELPVAELPVAELPVAEPAAAELTAAEEIIAASPSDLPAAETATPDSGLESVDAKESAPVAEAADVAGEAALDDLGLEFVADAATEPAGATAGAGVLPELDLSGLTLRPDDDEADVGLDFEPEAAAEAPPAPLLDLGVTPSAPAEAVGEEVKAEAPVQKRPRKPPTARREKAKREKAGKKDQDKWWGKKQKQPQETQSAAAEAPVALPSAEAPADAVAEAPAEALGESAADAVAGAPAEALAEGPAEAPAEAPAEVPAAEETVFEVPAGSPVADSPEAPFAEADEAAEAPLVADDLKFLDEILGPAGADSATPGLLPQGDLIAAESALDLSTDSAEGAADVSAPAAEMAGLDFSTLATGSGLERQADAGATLPAAADAVYPGEEGAASADEPDADNRAEVIAATEPTPESALDLPPGDALDLDEPLEAVNRGQSADAPAISSAAPAEHSAPAEADSDFDAMLNAVLDKATPVEPDFRFEPSADLSDEEEDWSPAPAADAAARDEAAFTPSPDTQPQDAAAFAPSLDHEAEKDTPAPAGEAPDALAEDWFELEAAAESEAQISADELRPAASTEPAPLDLETPQETFVPAAAVEEAPTEAISDPYASLDEELQVGAFDAADDAEDIDLAPETLALGEDETPELEPAELGLDDSFGLLLEDEEAEAKVETPGADAELPDLGAELDAEGLGDTDTALQDAHPGASDQDVSPGVPEAADPFMMMGRDQGSFIGGLPLSLPPAAGAPGGFGGRALDEGTPIQDELAGPINEAEPVDSEELSPAPPAAPLPAAKRQGIVPPPPARNIPPRVLPPQEPPARSPFDLDMGGVADGAVEIPPYRPQSLKGGPLTTAFDGLAVAPLREADVFSQLGVPVDPIFGTPSKPAVGKASPGAEQDASDLSPDFDEAADEAGEDAEAAAVAENAGAAELAEAPARRSALPPGAGKRADQPKGSNPSIGNRRKPGYTPPPADPNAGAAPPAKKRRWGVRFLLPMMLLCAAGAAAAIWFLQPMVRPLQAEVIGHIEFENLKELSEQERREVAAEQRKLLQPPKLQLIAAEILELENEQRGKSRRVPPGFLAPRNEQEMRAYLAIADGAAVPERGDRLVLVHRGADGPGDAVRMHALLKALHTENASLADNVNRLRSRHDAIERERANLIAEISELKTRVEAARGKDEIYLDTLSSRVATLEATDKKLSREQSAARVVFNDLEAQLQHAVAEGATPGDAATTSPATDSAAQAPEDPQLKEMARRLEELKASAGAARSAKNAESEKAARALDAALAQFDGEISEAQTQIGDDDQLAEYLMAAQRMQRTVGDLYESLREGQKAAQTRLNDLKRRLAEKLEAKLKEAWANDDELKALQETLSVREHHHNAAVANGLAPEAKKLAAQIEKLNAQIDARRELLGTGHAYAAEVKELQDFIDDSIAAMESERARNDKFLGELFDSFKKEAPSLEKLPAEQKRLAQALAKRSADLNAAREQYTRAMAAAESDAAETMESELAQVQAKMDARRKQLADAAAQDLTKQQRQDREMKIEQRKTAVASAKRAFDKAEAAWLANDQALRNAKRELVAAQDAFVQLQRDQQKLAQLERQLPRKTEQVAALQAQLKKSIAPLPLRDEPVTVRSESDPRLLWILISTAGIVMLFSMMMYAVAHAPPGDADDVPFAASAYAEEFDAPMPRLDESGAPGVNGNRQSRTHTAPEDEEPVVV